MEAGRFFLHPLGASEVDTTEERKVHLQKKSRQADSEFAAEIDHEERVVR